jgi:hypothetical protein
MKVGDKISVSVQGIEVAQADVKEVSDGTATLIIPATRVVMATRTELAPEVTPVNQGAQTIIDGVERAPVAPVEPAQNVSEVPAAEQSQAPTEEKVISSSSVPVPNQTSLESLDPAVQAKIVEMVNAHNAAKQSAEVQEVDGARVED